MTIINTQRDTTNDVAIIGMSGRFPGANTIQEFWNNLIAGKETTRIFNQQDLINAGLPDNLLDNPSYVPVRGVLESVDCFDADFFSYSPREAELIDPQQKIFLECAWAAMEDAGYVPDNYIGSVGVFAGSNQNTYQLFHVLKSEDKLLEAHGMAVHADKDFLATRVSYKLNLHGPSISVQTACSTSLVCIHLACQALLSMECDMALAGGVSVVFPQVGYLYQDGGVFSPDGHCRAFAQDANGTLGGDGVGVVLLKRFDDAVRDGDHIYATILGTAINNDGGHKGSYVAPSVDGQMQVIEEALGVSGIDPQMISYIETHGTGTPLGDMVEITALERAFGSKGLTPGSCLIGSLKPNFGHLDQAAGVASIIKVSLALKHAVLPPSLHCNVVNPELKLGCSPFVVNTKLTAWQPRSSIKYAGVSCFGFGGTNAHAILGEAPIVEHLPSSRLWHVLLLSARSEAELEWQSDQLLQFIAQDKTSSELADIAFVLQTGRKAFKYKRFLVVDSLVRAQTLLIERTSQAVVDGITECSDSKPVYFLFPGQGSQYVNMGRGLYESEPIFRREIDAMADIFLQEVGVPLVTALFDNFDGTSINLELNQTYLTQPLLFVLEYALAKLWMYYGVFPNGMIGHSVGEYVAACISGVFTAKDALKLLAIRGKLVQKLPPGAMLSVNACFDIVQNLVSEDISLAAINAPNLYVLSGSVEAISKLENLLSTKSIACKKLHVNHAFHSHMLDSILNDFSLAISKIVLSQPEVPFISNVTGNWITDEQATSPSYWEQHLRQTVLFADGIGVILAQESSILLEIGPGAVLSTLARQSKYFTDKHTLICSMRGQTSNAHDTKVFLTAVGKLWLAGITINWQKFYQHEKRHRLSLPTYPFKRTRYFITPRIFGQHTVVSRKITRQPQDKWLYLPSWKRTLPPVFLTTPKDAYWLAVTNDSDMVYELSNLLKQKYSIQLFCVPIDGDLTEFTNHIASNVQYPVYVLYLFNSAISPNHSHVGINGLLKLIKVLGNRNTTFPDRTIHLMVVTIGLQDVLGTEPLFVEDAPILGMCRVVSQELPFIRCKNIDFISDISRTQQLQQILAEWCTDSMDSTIAYRGLKRFSQTFEEYKKDNSISVSPSLIQEKSVVIITGGLGEIGINLAEYLAKTYQANLVLVGRSPIPDIMLWEDLIKEQTHYSYNINLLKRLKQLLIMGTELIVIQADVSNIDQMSNVFKKARKHFGRVDGVIHAAGISGNEVFKGLLETKIENLATHFCAKVEGVKVLSKLLENSEVQFCILQSSLFGITGGFGCGAYSAATSFVDTFATKMARSSSGTKWISIGWDAWLPEGSKQHGLTELSILPAEAYQVLESIFTMPNIGYVLVSTCDLFSRVSRWSNLDNKLVDKEETPSANSNQYERPILTNDYIAAESDIEKLLVTMWQELLGIKCIGVFDDFFELGGHSLSAINVVSHVKENFPINFVIHDLIDNTTIAQLAKIIETRILEKVESMSDEEANTILVNG